MKLLSREGGGIGPMKPGNRHIMHGANSNRWLKPPER